MNNDWNESLGAAIESAAGLKQAIKEAENV